MTITKKPIDEKNPIKEDDDDDDVEWYEQFATCRSKRHRYTIIWLGITGMLIGVTLLTLYTYMGIGSLFAIIFTIIPTLISGMACFCACQISAVLEGKEDERKEKAEEGNTEISTITDGFKDSPPPYSPAPSYKFSNEDEKALPTYEATQCPA